MKNILFSLMAAFGSFAQTTEEVAVNDLIKGTLYIPASPSEDTRLMIVIAGSGPTNRSGNQMGMMTNSYKLLAEDLSKQGIAVYTYDKRMFAQMVAGTLDETKMRFDDGIVDAIEIVDYFRKKKTYSKIVIAGHSEGSMVGMVAANGRADGFISIAGPGRPLEDVLLEQIGKNMPGLLEESKGYVSKLKNGETFKVQNPALQSIFRESVQPFFMSWMKYDPQREIAKLSIPVLIINGAKDLQVTENDAQMLKKAKPDATLLIIPDMAHTLKTVGSEAENRASYNKPALPLTPELTAAVNQFIKTL